MSKMSDIAMQLDEQCAELGFRDVEDAEQHGWRVNYEAAKLEPPVVQPEVDEMEELEKAHRQWLAERSTVLADLYALHKHFVEYGETQYAYIVKEAIRFIEGKEI